jgi:O-antigen ligase
MIKINYFNNQKLFFFLFALIYISGPLFTELFLLFLVFKSLTNLNLFKQKIIEDNRFVQIFFLIIFFQGFLNFPELNNKNLLYIRFYFYYLSIKILLVNDQNIHENFNLFIRTTIYVLSLLILFNLFQIYTGFFTIDSRITIPIRNEEIAMSIYSKFYPFVLVLLLFANRDFRNTPFFLTYKYLFWLVAILIPIVGIFSGERMNTIMLFLIIILILIKSKPIFSLYFFSILIFIYLLVKNFGNIFFIDRVDYIINRYKYFFDAITNNFLADSIWGNHYLTAINIFKNNIMFGVGINKFSSECIKYLSEYKFACTTHPHNIYLELASESGMLILILFIILYFSIFKICIINLLKKEFGINDIISLSLSICILLYGFPLRSTGSFFNNYNSSFFWVFLGLLYSFYENKKKI